VFSPRTAGAPPYASSGGLTGAATYAVLALTSTEPIAPDWTLGLSRGLGGLLGGYLGARLQPRLPEKALRRLRAATAVGLAVTYVVRALR
jgi:uncharacterized membrane protein YfcA